MNLLPLKHGSLTARGTGPREPCEDHVDRTARECFLGCARIERNQFQFDPLPVRAPAPRENIRFHPGDESHPERRRDLSVSCLVPTHLMIDTVKG